MSCTADRGRGVRRQQVVEAWVAEQAFPEFLRASWCLSGSLGTPKVFGQTQCGQDIVIVVAARSQDDLTCPIITLHELLLLDKAQRG